MITISKDNKFLTLINVFIVESQDQQPLVELLIKATNDSIRHAQGFISASLHSSLDCTKVTMYAQWQSIENYQRMRSNPTTSPYLEMALTIARFDPGMYEVVETFNLEEGR